MAKWTPQSQARTDLTLSQVEDLSREWQDIYALNAKGPAGAEFIERYPALFGDMQDRNVAEWFRHKGHFKTIGRAVHAIQSKLPRPEPIHASLGELRLPYADSLVIGDAQFPLYNKELLARALADAARRGIKRLVWNGDTFDFAGLGKYSDSLSESVSGTLDTVAQASIAAYESGITEQVWIFGNHDDRLARMTDHATNLADLVAMMLGRVENATLAAHLRESYRVTNRYYAVMDGQGETPWRFTHQKNYSTIRGRVATRLAEKFHMNIVSAHTHHAIVTRSESGRFWAVEGGCLQDRELTRYLFERDSLHPFHTMAYTLIEHDTPEVVFWDASPSWWAKRLGGESCNPIVDLGALNGGSSSPACS